MTVFRPAPLAQTTRCAVLPALAIALTLALSPNAFAIDLAQAFESAQRYDTLLNSARLQLDAARERLPQAQAGLKPSLGAVAGATAGRLDTDVAASRSFDNLSGGLNFSYPLYRPGNSTLVDQAAIGVELAQTQLAQAAQDLVTRVSTAYFDVLSAMDGVEVAIAQRRAISEQFEAAKRNFEVGTATVTDQQEAQARLDLNAAQLAAARNDLLIRRAALSQLTGLDSEELNTLKLDVPLPVAEPNSLDDWTARARTGNFGVRQAELAVATARKEIDRARFAKRPVVDLVSQASVLQGKTASTVTTPVDRSSTLSAGVQLSVPLYSGGGLDARERETIAALQKSESDLENVRRVADQGARQAFLGLKSSTEQARALEAAVRSSRLALESNLLGYQVGVRVNVDVLNSQQQLFQAFRDLSRARYDVLINTLRLKSTAGELQSADIAAVNGLLSPSVGRNFPVLGSGAPATVPAAPAGTAARPGARTRPAPVVPRDFGGRTTKPIAPGEPRVGPRAPMPR